MARRYVEEDQEEGIPFEMGLRMPFQEVFDFFKCGKQAYDKEDWPGCYNLLMKFIDFNKKFHLDGGMGLQACAMLLHTARHLHMPPPFQINPEMKKAVAESYEKKRSMIDLSNAEELREFFVWKMVMSFQAQQKWLHECFARNKEVKQLTTLLLLCKNYGLEDHVKQKDKILLDDLDRSWSILPKNGDEDVNTVKVFVLDVCWKISPLPLYLVKGFCHWQQTKDPILVKCFLLPGLEHQWRTKGDFLKKFLKCLLDTLEKQKVNKKCRAAEQLVDLIHGRNEVEEEKVFDEEFFEISLEREEYSVAEAVEAAAIRLLPNWSKARYFGLRKTDRNVQEHINKLNSFMVKSRKPSSADVLECLAYVLVHLTITDLEKLSTKLAMTTNHGMAFLTNCCKNAQWDLLFKVFLCTGPESFKKLLTPKVKASVNFASILLSGSWNSEYVDVLLKAECPKGKQPCLDYCLEKDVQLALKLLCSSHLVFKNEVKGITMSDPLSHKIVKFAIKCGRGEVISAAQKMTDPKVNFEEINSHNESILHVLAKTDVGENVAVECITLMKYVCIDILLENSKGKTAKDLIMDKKFHTCSVLFDKSEDVAEHFQETVKDAVTAEVKVLTPAVSYKHKTWQADPSPKAQVSNNLETKMNHQKAAEPKLDLEQECQLLNEMISSLDMTSLRADSSWSTSVTEQREETAFSGCSIDKELEINENDAVSIASNEFVFEEHAWEIILTNESFEFLMNAQIEHKSRQELLELLNSLGKGEVINGTTQLSITSRLPVNLYYNTTSKGIGIIWEERPFFSERCSKTESAESGKLKSDGSHIYVEAILLWDVITDPAQLESVVKRIENAHQKGQMSRSKCHLRVHSKYRTNCRVNQLKVPVHYSLASEKDFHNDKLCNALVALYPLANSEEIDHNAMRTYTLHNAIGRQEKLLTGATVPFRMSENEFDIVNLDVTWPIILLGRSGTGKTTCCVNRLWESYKNWKFGYCTGLEQPWNVWKKQATEDPDEVESIAAEEEQSKYTSDEKSARNQQSQINRLVVKSLHDDLQSREAEPTSENKKIVADCEISDAEDNDDIESVTLKQVFITKNHKLTDKVSGYFQSLCMLHPDWHNSDNDKMEISKINSLEDVPPQSFPLFVTSYEWLYLLDKTLPGERFLSGDEFTKLENVEEDARSEGDESDVEFVDNEEDEEFQTRPEYIKVQEIFKKQEVTFTEFAGQIWSELNQKVSLQGISPSLLWTEIQSFIKGSYDALTSKDGHLNKEGYESVGRRKAPNFAGNRGEIYDAFCFYEKIKRKRGMYDVTDIVLNLYKRLMDGAPHRWQCHEVYIDEAQDFTESELYLLLCCCKSSQGMFITGDTAQNIARGVSFRFRDVKTLFFRHSKIAIQDIYQLTCNYRSHDQIICLAGSVLHLLQSMFPDTVDPTAAERGLFNGPKPLILQAEDKEQLSEMLLANASDGGAKQLEFGAEQVIIVASEESKANLPDVLRFSLCMTIEEAKGLEFNDVLLYNFFNDSQATDEWKTVTQFTAALPLASSPDNSQTGIAVVDLDSMSKPHNFDGCANKVLNSELKLLYTAITRARVNVWIYDESKKARAPMFSYFQSYNLVDVFDMHQDIDSSKKRSFAVSSTPEQWNRKGEYLFENNNYAAAAVCFRKAGNQPRETICQGNICREKAYSRPLKVEKEGLLVQAVVYFLQVGDIKTAATCLLESEKWKLLALLYEKHGKLNAAAKYYLKADHLFEAIRCCKRTGNFKKTFDILRSKGKFLDCFDLHVEMDQSALVKLPFSIDIRSFVSEGLLFYLKRNMKAYALKLLEYLPTLADREKMLLDCEVSTSGIVLEFYKQNRMSKEAGEYLFEKSQYQEALKHYEGSTNFTVKCHLRYAEKAAVQIMSRRVHGNKPFKEIKEKHLDVAIGLLKEDPNCHAGLLAECFFLKGLILCEWSESLDACSLFVSQRHYYEAICCYLCVNSAARSGNASGVQLNELILNLFPLLQYCATGNELPRQCDREGTKEQLNHCMAYFGVTFGWDHNGKFVKVSNENRYNLITKADFENGFTKAFSFKHAVPFNEFRRFLAETLFKRMLDAVEGDLQGLGLQNNITEVDNLSLTETDGWDNAFQNVILQSILHKLNVAGKVLKLGSKRTSVVPYRAVLAELYQFILKKQGSSDTDMFQKLAKALFDTKNSHVINMIHRYISKWRGKSYDKKIGNVEEFMMMAFYSHLLMNKYFPPEYCNEVVQAARWVGGSERPTKGTFEYPCYNPQTGKTRMRWKMMIDYFFQMLDHLNKPEQLHQAVFYAQQFIVSVSFKNHYQAKAMMSPLLHLIQYTLVLCMAGYCLVDKETIFLLPASYVASFDFWNASYTSFNGKIKLTNIFSSTMSRHEKSFKSTVNALIHLICGKKDSRNLPGWIFDDARGATFEVCHQMVTLFVTLVTNAKQLQLGYSQISTLAECVDKVRSSDQGKQFLPVLNALTFGGESNKEILEMLLHLSKQALHTYSWNEKRCTFVISKKTVNSNFPGGDSASDSADLDAEEVEDDRMVMDEEVQDDTEDRANDGRAAEVILRFTRKWIVKTQYITRESCLACGIAFPCSDSWKGHLVSKDHTANVKKRRWTIGCQVSEVAAIGERAEQCNDTVIKMMQRNETMSVVKTNLARVNQMKDDISRENIVKTAQLIEELKSLLSEIEQTLTLTKAKLLQSQEDAALLQPDPTEGGTISEAEEEEFQVVSYKKRIKKERSHGNKKKQGGKRKTKY